MIYFDNAATSQKPRAVIDSLVRYYERDNPNVHRGIHELSNRATTAYEGARVRAAKFVNARSADEIVFTRGTTEGINLVANSWGTKNLKPGDVILLTEMEHHSNLVPWQLIAQRTGAKLVYVPVTGDEAQLDLAKLDSLLTSQVKLFAMVHISNSTGTVNPVAEMNNTDVIATSPSPSGVLRPARIPIPTPCRTTMDCITAGPRRRSACGTLLSRPSSFPTSSPIPERERCRETSIPYLPSLGPFGHHPIKMPMSGHTAIR